MTRVRAPSRLHFGLLNVPTADTPPNAKLFGGVGLLTIASAVRNSARLLSAPLLLIAIGFSGRLLTIALTGYDAAMLPPMVVETVLSVLFATGRKFLPAK